MNYKSTFILFILISLNAYAKGAYPVNQISYIKNGKFNNKYISKVIAIEGTIKSIKKGPVGKPLLELKIPKQGVKSIWIGSLLNNKNKSLRVGNKIRVLGFLNKIQKNDNFLTAVTKDSNHMLGFCIYNFNTKRGLYLPAGVNQCKAWESGIKAKDLM